MSDFQHLELRHEGDVLWVTMNRPDRLNALNPRMVNELRGLFTELYWQRTARVVVLTGAGNNFCAGLDLKERQGAKARSVSRHMDAQHGISATVIAMRRCPQPIVALINGAASGGGFGLALAADVRIATKSARMNAAFIQIGLSGCDIGVSYFLPRMVGASVAAEYMLTGRFLTAQRAYELGLVSRVVDGDVLEAEGRSLVSEMLNASPLGLRLTKDALNLAIDAQSLEAVIAMEDRNQLLTARDPNFLEGIAAFLEKRPPRYVHDDPEI
jgi:enoyl-CoA hydratase